MKWLSRPVRLLIVDGIRSKVLAGPPSDERIDELVRLLPRSMKWLVTLTASVLLPGVFMVYLYFATKVSVQYLLGGWTIQTRWLGAGILLVLCVPGVLVYDWVWHALANLLCRYLNQRLSHT